MIEQLIKWDDLRFVLAIKRSRTLSGAGRSLSLSHATVFRRLESLERRLGVQLFERDRSGYSPTVAGEHLCAAAERVETEVATAERRIVGQDLKPEGTLRVTATDTLCFGLLMPLCQSFRQQVPRHHARNRHLRSALQSLETRSGTSPCGPRVAHRTQ